MMIIMNGISGYVMKSCQGRYDSVTYVKISAGGRVVGTAVTTGFVACIHY